MRPPAEPSGLDTCGCCEVSTPEPEIFNRPGLPAVAYRIGTHPTFLQRMLGHLPLERVPDQPPDRAGRPLAALTTRTPDDPAIALLDAWATVADVLTFYQERIANEGFLRTATERRSVLELARMIGYELNPGVAAGAYLAFTIEDAPGAPGAATIPAGTKIQSIPGQNERPQTFETAETIHARAAWNALRPRLTAPQVIQRGVRELYLKGVATQLQPGDGILIVGAEREGTPQTEQWDFRILETVTPVPNAADPDKSYTLVTWKKGLGSTTPPTTDPAQLAVRVYAFRLRAALFGHNPPDWRAMPDVVRKAYLFAARGSIAGYNPEDPATWGADWPPELFRIRSIEDRTIDLDAAYAKIVAGSWVVLRKPGWTELYKPTKVAFDSRTDFTLSGKITRLTLDTNQNLSLFGLRETVVFAHSEPLEMIEKPLPDPVQGDEIPLHRLVSGLTEGQTLVVSGKPVPALVRPAVEEAETVHEVAVVRRITAHVDRTTITLRAPLSTSLDRATVTIAANVARATHGETVKDEVLGSGDGAQAYQRFVLKKPPLTYVSAATAGGAQSTLTLRVNGVAWEPAPSLFGLVPSSQSYVVRIDADGKAIVIFGDGERGARVPTGQENITATYRSGIGTAGLVGADRLTLLPVRPLGVRAVTNPLPAAGAADPESLEDARSHAPFTVLTLDRVVSLRDFEYFAEAFAGIGKARAVALWTGEQAVVHLTIAAADGTEVSPTSDLFINLVRAIDAQRDPGQRVAVASFRRCTFGLTARILHDPRHVRQAVLDRVRADLLQAFSFARREFGQPVTAAEVITVIQAAPGVVATDLDQLILDPPCGPGASATGPQPQAVLPARVARRLGETTDLLVVNSAGITLNEMPS